MIGRRLAVGLLVLPLVLAGCGQTSLVSEAGKGYVAADGSIVLRDVADRGEPLAWVGQTVAGGSWSLASLRGRVVLLNAWGPWCAPCRTEVPRLQQLRDDLNGKGLEVVGFATRTNRTAVEAFTTRENISFTQVADYDSAMLLSIRGVPSMSIPGTLIIDRRGRVAGWALGAVDVELLRGFAQSLLEETA